MTKETKSNLLDATIFLSAIAVILMLWAGTLNWIHSKESKYIQQVSVDGQGK